MGLKLEIGLLLIAMVCLFVTPQKVVERLALRLYQLKGFFTRRIQSPACGPGWVCTPRTLCPPSERSSTSDISCSTRPDHVCCCDSTTSSGCQSISAQKCREWSELVIIYQKTPGAMPWDEEVITKNDQCPMTAQPLILGGMDAIPNEFPHMCVIGYKLSPTRWLCGASLISEQYVLTAAHCSYGGIRWGPALFVKLGNHDLSSEDGQPRVLVLRVALIINHPKFQRSLGYHDIALIRLEAKVTFDSGKRPACLPSPGTPVRYKEAIATGWGHTEFAGEQSTVLQKVDLTLIPLPECKKSYGPSPKVPDGLNDQCHFCAGGTDGKDTCQGDSGGPLQVALKDPYCVYKLIGITSFGGICGRGPAVYTNISTYVPWIESVVWPS